MHGSAYMKELNDNEKLLFQNELGTKQKKTSTAVLLALFLGGIGAHHFYMGQPGLGVVYILFCITFIPAFVAFIEAFLMKQRVEDYNNHTAQQDIVLRLKHYGDTFTVSFDGFRETSAWVEEKCI